MKVVLNKKIVFNKVTWYSQLLAIILYVSTFVLGFYFGGEYKEAMIASIEQKPVGNIITATFNCAGEKIIFVKFLSRGAIVYLKDRELVLPQTISASGARYANADESIVFWNKGNTAFIQENGAVTYSDCVEKE
ncbi:MAG: MliC family protein [Candidatus Pacebacteria bacterium]|nr:MliC family protein [Candidatus Paceibacterota bacterium]